MNQLRRDFLTRFLGGGFALAASGQLLPTLATADGPALSEPVHRVASASTNPPSGLVRPLDTAMQIARDGLLQCRAQINDYTAMLVKRERVDGVLGDHDFIFVKVRNRKVVDGQIVQPLSVYRPSGRLRPNCGSASRMGRRSDCAFLTR